MRKLLVVGALAVIALLVLMLHEIRAQVDAAPVAAKPSPPPIVAPAPAPVQPPVKLVAPAPQPVDDGKVNPNSDEFLDRFIDKQPRMASRAAMSCYHGG